MVTYDARPSAFTQLTTTAEWEYLFSAAGIRDGIDGSTAAGPGAMLPSLDTAGRNAVIAAGNCIIKGQLWRCDASVSTPIPAASAQNRIDRLTIRLTRGATTSPTVVQPFVITGTPATSPVEPPLVQTPAGIWDIPVCSWTSTSAGALTGLVDERQFSSDYWHDLRPASSGWSGSVSGEYPPQYRASHGRVELFGAVTLGSPYTGVNVFANPLPVAYRPNHVARFPLIFFPGSSVSLTNTPLVAVQTTGFIMFYNVPAGLGATNVFISGSYPLDNSGVIQS